LLTPHSVLPWLQIQHYLEEAKIQYAKFFEKMQNFYQPVTVFGGERWLHAAPSGMQ
jgi:hypothetical protein